jgi:hypothetical protein
LGPPLLDDDDRITLLGYDSAPTRFGACGGGGLGRVDELDRGFVLHPVHSQDDAVPSGLDDLDLDGPDEDPLSNLAGEREHEVDYHEGARGWFRKRTVSGGGGAPPIRVRNNPQHRETAHGEQWNEKAQSGLLILGFSIWALESPKASTEVRDREGVAALDVDVLAHERREAGDVLLIDRGA